MRNIIITNSAIKTIPSKDKENSSKINRDQKKVPAINRSVEFCNNEKCRKKAERLKKEYEDLIEDFEAQLNEQQSMYGECLANNRLIKSFSNERINKLKSEYDAVIEDLNERLLNQSLEIDKIKQAQAIAETKLIKYLMDLIGGIACAYVAHNGIKIAETFGSYFLSNEENVTIMNKLGAIAIECFKDLVVLSIGIYCYKVSSLSEYSLVNRGLQLINGIAEKMKQICTIMKFVALDIKVKMKLLFLLLKNEGLKHPCMIGFIVFCIYSMYNKANILANKEFLIKWWNGEEMSYPSEWYQEIGCKS